MPLLHCKECHHEWESAPIDLFDVKGQKICDWCGCKEYTILAKETSLEKFINNGSIFKVIPGLENGILHR